MDSKDVIVSDSSIINALSSKNDELKECGGLIIEFLAWRKHYKKIMTIPKIYDQMYEKAKEQDELRAYFENFFESATFIGMSEKNPDEKEFFTLIFSLYYSGNLVIFVSNDAELLDKIKNAKIPKTVCKTVHEFRSFIQSKKDFWDFIFYKYYDSSA